MLTDRDILDARIPGRDLLIVTNTTVAKLYLAKLTGSFAQRRIAECILPDGEQHKTLQTAGWVFDALVANKMNRDATVLALGGGVVGDIAGFAAASYQRGIGYVQLPTTLLAQVDSSVGGKTGVNHPGGKNLIGAFYQPRAVIADTNVLATLPDRELKSGLAEVIKHGCVWDPLLFNWLDRSIPQLLARDAEALTYAIGRSCEIKATVVARDEREHDLRAILNFGHTFGHAIEAATGYEKYLHGEAVGLGMLIAADLSHRLAMQVFLVGGCGLNGVAEGMAEIEDCPQIALAFVPRNHDGFYLARPADGILQRLGIPRQQLDNVAVKPIEQQRIPDAAVLDHLGEA